MNSLFFQTIMQLVYPPPPPPHKKTLFSNFSWVLLWLAKWCKIHKFHIHSHSTTTSSINMYTNSRSARNFLVTNMFIHIRNIYSFTFKVIICIQHLVFSFSILLMCKIHRFAYSFTLNVAQFLHMNLIYSLFLS